MHGLMFRLCSWIPIIFCIHTRKFRGLCSFMKTIPHHVLIFHPICNTSKFHCLLSFGLLLHDLWMSCWSCVSENCCPEFCDILVLQWKCPYQWCRHHYHSEWYCSTCNWPPAHSLWYGMHLVMEWGLLLWPWCWPNESLKNLWVSFCKGKSTTDHCGSALTYSHT